MIDITVEQPISLRDAAGLLPSNRKGKKVSFQCLLRWVLDGSLGPDGERIRLEALRLGNRYITSREALQRFALRLTPPEKKPTRKPRTPKQARTACEQASRELEEMGV
jgi:hypothetical protein